MNTLLTTSPEKKRNLSDLFNNSWLVLIFHKPSERILEGQEEHRTDLIKCTCGAVYPISSIRILILAQLTTLETDQIMTSGAAVT